MYEAGADLDRVGDTLRREGWKVSRGFSLPQRAWSVAGLNLVCVGTVGGPDEAAAAVLAAARGAGVVIEVAGDGVRERLFEDLSRLGMVTVTDEASGPVEQLKPEGRELLGLLADGASLDEAASALNYSRRTIERRLTAARAALGAHTTAEALVYFKQNRAQS
jgi:DNA-binding NarL/FixJ family response regulator